MQDFDLDSLAEEVVSAELIAASADRIDYEVHLKYVSCIANLSEGLSISHSFKPKIDAAALKVLDSKLRLVERTNNLLEEEIEFIRVDPEYAQACVGWLPAKVYYNIYHLLAIIEYILTGQKLHLRISHESCLKGFAKRIDGGILKFNCPTLNIVCDKAILKFRSVSGETLSKGITDERLISLVMKKIATDKLDDFKLRKGLDLRKKADKSKYQKAKEELNISIIDFFYSMRIRTNYRDMSFLDELDAERTRRYFLKYHEASTNFFNCLNEFKNDLVASIH